MTKADLVDMVTEKAAITRTKAEIVVSTIFDSIVDALINEDRVEVRGFGTFVVRRYEAYKGRNPRTGLVISVDAKKLPFFRTGKDLKKAIDSKR